MVDVHALRKRGFAIPLYDMDHHDLLGAVAAPDFHQLVGQPSAQFGVADNLLKFGIQAFAACLSSENSHSSAESLFVHFTLDQYNGLVVKWRCTKWG